MDHLSSPTARATLLASLLFAVALATAATSVDARPDAPRPSSPPAPAAQEPAGLAGQDTCLFCHEEKAAQMAGTLHGRTQDPRSPASALGCESCHGPGQAHAESADPALIRTFTTTPPREASETCVGCHDRGPHAQWSGSMHDARNVSCVTCHSVHSAREAEGELKLASEIETCGSCHQAQVRKIERVAHMPVREGKMACSSCHNPHGSTNVRLLKTGNWINESCVSCHADRRGPFLWEHAAGRESCVTCHDPHGSSNDRMLVAKLPMLCQRCHIGTRHPSTIYDNTQLNSNRLFGRSCVNCHQAIHGTNHPSGHSFLR